MIPEMRGLVVGNSQRQSLALVVGVLTLTVLLIMPVIADGSQAYRRDRQVEISGIVIVVGSLTEGALGAWLDNKGTMALFSQDRRDASRREEARDSEPGSIDWMDLAFRRAAVLGGHASPEETLDLVHELITFGQLEKAREILEKGPKLPEGYRIERLDALLALETAEYFLMPEAEKDTGKEKVQSLLRQLSREEGLAKDRLVRYLKQAEEFHVPDSVVIFSGELGQTDHQPGRLVSSCRAVESGGKQGRSGSTFLFPGFGGGIIS